jgi:hypothetical protein
MLHAVKKKVALSPTSACCNNAINTNTNKFRERRTICPAVSQMTTRRTFIAVQQDNSNYNNATLKQIKARTKSSGLLVNVKTGMGETQLNLVKPPLKAEQTTQMARDTENSCPKQNSS